MPPSEGTPSADSTVKPWNEEPPTLSGWRLGVLTLSLLIGFFLSILDTTIVATALFSISTEFGSLSTTFWVVLAYTLAYVSFTSVFARISDFTGRKYATIAAFSIFLGGSLGCGWSKNINTLIGCRGLQGMGGAGLFSLALTVIIEVTPDQRKAAISGLIGVALAVAGALGPLLGGELSQHATWRWVFWINGPCCIIGIVLFIIAWPNTDDINKKGRPIKEFDWAGTGLLMAASILTIYGLQSPAEGYVMWDSAGTIVTIIIGGLCWIGLFTYQYFIRSTKLAAAFPFQFLRNRALACGFLFTLLAGFVGNTAIYTIPLRYQLVNGQTPSQAGIKLLPFLCSSAVGSAVAGAASSKKNRVFFAFMGAAFLMIIGVGLLSTLDNKFEIEAKEYGFQVLLGLGTGASASSISIMAAAETRPQDRSVSQGVGGQARILGLSIGIAAANGLNARHFSNLVGKLPPAILELVKEDVGAIASLKPAQQELVRGVYSDGFTDTMRLSLYVAAVAVVVAACTYQKNPPQLADKPPPKTESASVSSEKVTEVEVAAKV